MFDTRLPGKVGAAPGLLVFCSFSFLVEPRVRGPARCGVSRSYGPLFFWNFSFNPVGFQTHTGRNPYSAKELCMVSYFSPSCPCPGSSPRPPNFSSLRLGRLSPSSPPCGVILYQLSPPFAWYSRSRLLFSIARPPHTPVIFLPVPSTTPMPVKDGTDLPRLRHPFSSSHYLR